MSFGSCPHRSPVHTLCGKDISEIRREHRRLLFEEFLPWWESHGIDRTNGGFFSQLDPDGAPRDLTKNMWYQGRGLWTFSHLYNRFDDDPRHLETAIRAAEFVLRHGRDASGDWLYLLTPEGAAASNAKNIFGGIFVIYGLVELYRASGETGYLDTAHESSRRIIEKIESPDFCEVDPALPPGARVHGLWMIFISVLTELLKERADGDIESSVRGYIRRILDYHFDTATGLIIENLSHDYQRLSGELKNLVNAGHVGECVWMVKHEAERVADAGLIPRMIDLLRPHLEAAWDDEYGGLFWSIDGGSQRPINDAKSGWAHQEYMLSLLEAIEYGSFEWAIDLYERISDYAFRTFTDGENGQWHRVVTRQNALLPYSPGQKFIGNETRDIFHFPRYLMFTIEILERLEKRREKMS